MLTRSERQAVTSASCTLAIKPTALSKLRLFAATLSGSLVGEASGVFENAAVLDAHDAAGVLGDVFSMGDQNNCAPFGVKLFEQSEDFVAALAVQGAGGLVGENHRRVVHQGAGDGDALLLAAGKFRRTMLGAVAEAEAREQARGALGALVLGQAGVHRGNLHVLAGGGRGQ